MKILITGAAGFIGHALIKRLYNDGADIVGIDCINDYYDPQLKWDRLADMGLKREDIETGAPAQSSIMPTVRFVKTDLTDKTAIDHLFATEHFTHVVNLGGQAGVRYSIENPDSYVMANVVGFLNILEGCRHHSVTHLVYASSSSIYGQADHVPFVEEQDTDHPVSLYAATKKSNELMAHAYSKLYGFQTTGLRFFTVYGPWGRPDMAPFKFMDAIVHDRPIAVYNNGEMLRDFTYIDDIVQGVCLLLQYKNHDEVPATAFNIGCSNPVKLLDFITEMEKVIGKKAQKNMMGMQPGDVTRTYADTTKLHRLTGYTAKTNIADGLGQLYQWYCRYYLHQ